MSTRLWLVAVCVFVARWSMVLFVIFITFCVLVRYEWLSVDRLIFRKKGTTNWLYLVCNHFYVHFLVDCCLLSMFMNVNKASNQW
jgi:hypothetical protein